MGLCFLCEEKWFKGHKCKEKKDFLCWLQMRSIVMCWIGKKTSESFSISLQALSGIAQYSTMKLRGIVQEKPLIILVDSGSTHNFNDSERLRIPSTSNEVFEVLVANGEKLLSRGMCTYMVITCQGKNLKVNLLITYHRMTSCSRG